MIEGNDLHVGDKMWFVEDGYPVGVLVSIMSIDNAGDFVLDEPVGYAVSREDLFFTKEDAAICLLELVAQAAWMFKEIGLETFAREMTLEQCRRARILSFAGDRCCASFSDPSNWAEKSRECWFSLEEAKSMRGTPISEFESLYG